MTSCTNTENWGGFLASDQSGFRALHSSTTCLLKCTDQWRLVVFFAGGASLRNTGCGQNILGSHTQKMTLDSITSRLQNTRFFHIRNKLSGFKLEVF